MTDRPSPRFPLRVVLRDGTPAVVRPIREDEGDKLADGLQKLSVESRRRRFLSVKSHLSRREREFLTRCDMVNHLALGLAITDAAGEEQLSVAIARCIRQADDATCGDVAVVVLDEWQHRGIGRILMATLAELSQEVGIKRWRAHFFADNLAPRRLLEQVGRRESEHLESGGIVEVVFELFPAQQ